MFLHFLHYHKIMTTSHNSELFQAIERFEPFTIYNKIKGPKKYRDVTNFNAKEGGHIISM